MSLYPLALQRLHQTVVGAAAGTAKGSSTSSIWRYATDDAAATVEAAGYFNGAVKLLAVGDTIDATMAFSGTPVRKGYVVTGNTGTVVTVALQTTAAG